MSDLETTSFAGANGNQLAADIYHCQGSDHVALLLHGGGQTRHSWQATGKNLVNRGVTAICVDARGHGESQWLADKSYTFISFAKDVVELAKAVKARFAVRPIAIGASLGGISAMLAQDIARQDLLQALVLVDITPKMDLNGVAKILGFMSANLNSGFANIEEAAAAIARYLPNRKKPKSLNGLKKNLRQHDDGRWYWHWDPAFLDGPQNISTAQPEFQQELLDAAAKLTIPTLLVRGAQSELVSKSLAEEFLALVPHAKYADVSNADHMVAGDRNDIFSNAVLDFLDENILA